MAGWFFIRAKVKGREMNITIRVNGDDMRLEITPETPIDDATLSAMEEAASNGTPVKLTKLIPLTPGTVKHSYVISIQPGDKTA